MCKHVCTRISISKTFIKAKNTNRHLRAITVCFDMFTSCEKLKNGPYNAAENYRLHPRRRGLSKSSLLWIWQLRAIFIPTLHSSICSFLTMNILYFDKYFLIHFEEENFSTSSKSIVIAQMPLTERKERGQGQSCVKSSRSLVWLQKKKCKHEKLWSHKQSKEGSGPRPPGRSEQGHCH